MAVEIQTVNWAQVAALLGAGFCMGFGSLGPALGQGLTGAKACEAVGRKPESYGQISKTMYGALTITESSAIYCFVIALLLIIWGRAL
ncbi:ATP synthase F0 subunit C [Candidatus Babeliales bacterium]|nr:ATP synthase F0 subunit C [Candidatus Babeliales bacterium]